MGRDAADQLDHVARELDRASYRLAAIAARTPNDRWAQRPDPTRWAVAECVAHLNLTTRAYLPLLDAAIGAAPPHPGGPYRPAFAGRAIALLAGPLPRIGRRRIGRARTPAAFVPGGELPRDDVLAEFAQGQAALRADVAASRGRAIDRPRFESPFAAGIRYDAYSALVILTAHEHRHLDQAEDVWPAR
jgi:hypothetical protein